MPPPTDPAPPHRQLRSVAIVALGGLFGAPARYAIENALPGSDRAFPTATFITNLSGAFALGLLLEALVRRGADEGRRRSARLLLGVGFCGAYTTYSTFAVDTDNLLRADRVAVAFAYGIGTVVLGLVATAAGIAVAAWHHRLVSLPADPDAPDIDDADGVEGRS